MHYTSWEALGCPEIPDAPTKKASEDFFGIDGRRFVQGAGCVALCRADGGYFWAADGVFDYGEGMGLGWSVMGVLGSFGGRFMAGIG